MISAEHLTKSFAGAGSAVLRGVTFKVERGKVYTLLGPSGCGKTTSMRCVAGLEAPDAGRIVLGGRTVFCAQQRINVAPDRRNIGMVFQSYAIWPHMTVAQNVAYPLEGRRLSGDAIRRRAAAALDLVGLTGLGDRPAPNLSGGQQQRVALARAIVGEPELLLLDEPLSNLDAKLREQMRGELTALQRRLDQTMLYVTHDQEEALAISHRIALMRAGEIVEEGDPVSMYHHPHHPFTAGFLGAANFVRCHLDRRPRAGEQVEVETVFGRFTATARRGEGKESMLFFRPHRARIAAANGAAALNQGHATIFEASFLGATSDLLARKGDAVIRLQTADAGGVAADRDVSFTLDPHYSVAFVPDVG